jgi:hypothetical protein
MQSHRTDARFAVLAAVGLTILILLSGCDAWTTVQGTVRDGKGKPIPDAIVTLKMESYSQEFHSDKDGRYLVQISQPPWKADCNLTVKKTGFVPIEKLVRGPGVYKDFDVVLEPVSADLSPLQNSSTPQSIARAMFPNAPEKAKSASCFRTLTPEMSMNTVVQKCGRPDEELGSGIYIFVWHLADDSTVSVGTPYLEKIGDIRFTDASGKKSSLLNAKKRP